jgi:hypothetical protein
MEALAIIYVGLAAFPEVTVKVLLAEYPPTPLDQTLETIPKKVMNKRKQLNFVVMALILEMRALSVLAPTK